MTKKIFVILLAIVTFACLFVACGDSNEVKPTVAPTAAPTTEPTAVPTATPTAEPTLAPTAEPTDPSPENPLTLWLVSDVKVRPKPNTVDRELTVYFIGTEIQVIGFLTAAETETDYDWFVIEYDGGENNRAYLAAMEDAYSDENPNLPSPEKPWSRWLLADMNLRKTPGGELITTLPVNTEVTIIDYIYAADCGQQYDQYVVLWEGAEGNMAYLAVIDENYSDKNPNIPTPENPWTIWNIGDMNIRDAADGNRITTLPPNTEITVIGMIDVNDTPNKNYTYLIIVYEDGPDGVAYMAYLPENFTTIER